MISANGGLPAHRYTPQVTPRWPRGSKPASASSPHYHEGHAWESHSAVWAEALTAQTTSLAGRLKEVRTRKVTTQLRSQVARLTLGLTVAGMLGASFRQLAFQPGAFRISATSTVTDTKHHRHNLYLSTSPTGTYVRECT